MEEEVQFRLEAAGRLPKLIYKRTLVIHQMRETMAVGRVRATASDLGRFCWLYGKVVWYNI